MVITGLQGLRPGNTFQMQDVPKHTILRKLPEKKVDRSGKWAYDQVSRKNVLPMKNKERGRGMERLEKWMRPVWAKGEIYRETFAMIVQEGECRAPFARLPKKVLRVESYDGRVCYEEGRDYRVEDGFLAVPAGSRICCTGWDHFLYETRQAAQEAAEGRPPLGFGPVEAIDGRYLNLSAVGCPQNVTCWQAAVTYTTQEDWQGEIPQSAEGNLPRFFGKCKKGEPVRIVLYGDSISCGWDCSGMYGQEPRQPAWDRLLLESLQKRCQGPVEWNNTSVGGVDTEWAIANARDRASGYCPDLVILGFGMNDRCRGAEYRDKTMRLMEAIQKDCPDVEFLLIATTLPNELAATDPFWFCAFQQEQEEAVLALQGDRVGVANVQAVQRVLQKRKRYIDLTGNWLNHPNDFLARIQAQVVDAALTGY